MKKQEILIKDLVDIDGDEIVTSEELHFSYKEKMKALIYNACHEMLSDMLGMEEELPECWLENWVDRYVEKRYSDTIRKHKQD